MGARCDEWHRQRRPLENPRRPPRSRRRLCFPVTCSTVTMGNLVSLSTPRSAVKSFHEFRDVPDIDLKPVDFSTLAGKVRGGGQRHQGRRRAGARAAFERAAAAVAAARRLRLLAPPAAASRPPQVVLVSNVASK